MKVKKTILLVVVLIVIVASIVYLQRPSTIVVEETGEEIGLDRLEARPIATLCLDAQERWELRQRQLGDSR